MKVPYPEVVYRALSWTESSSIKTVEAHLNEASRRNIDLVVLVRGGGPWSQLRGYERLDLALAIHKSRVPVATAVGHNADISLADRAAVLSFTTPTAAAEAISNELRREQRPAAKQKREGEVVNADRENDPVLQEVKGAPLRAALLAREIQNVGSVQQ
jgi:exonuclease VII large subunit